MTRRRSAAFPGDDDQRFSFAVRIWKISTYEGKRSKTYKVRWIVAGEEQHETFATYTLADGFRSKLVGHQRKGSRFDIATGLPEPMLRAQSTRCWYQHMCSYIDAKWPLIAPKSRKSIADALSSVTQALLTGANSRPDAQAIRKVVYSWVCVAPSRAAGSPPAELVPVIRWLERNTIDMADFQDRTRGPELTRQALDAVAVYVDGKTRAAPNTISRRRAAFYNVLSFGVEQGLLAANPIDYVTWRIPKATKAIDRSAVISLHQGKQLLDAVGEQGKIGERLVAFFALMFYAALRPAEALRLSENNFVDMPDEGWGEMVLGMSLPRSGVVWSNTGVSREDRELKHRAKGDSRTVPMPPELIQLIRHHIAEFSVAPGGRLFVGPLGGTPDESTYLRIWKLARSQALSEQEAASRLAARPYDLRHFAISYWLNAGVSVSQAAEWAGNSEAVIWSTYSKLIKGKDKESRGKVERAMLDDRESEADQD